VKVAVFGATGVIGYSAAEHFSALPGWDVVTVSRRPVDLPGVTHVAVDLSDGAASGHALRTEPFRGTTHVVFAALQESHALVPGWSDRDLMVRNLQMFRHALEPLAAAGGLEHVSLLQGAKAYGFHIGRAPLPAKERAARDTHENFYFLQEDALREAAEGAPWSWTILRPQVVFGESIGSPMNLLPALGAYASLERECGRALGFPGGRPGVHEAVDARLLARALAWAAVAPEARGETFNVTNGDVFSWPAVWPAVAGAFGMEVGADAPQRLAETMPPRQDEWAAVVDRYGLRAPREMTSFVGASWVYADMLLGSSRQVPALLSTVKIRQAGFGDCTDTEDMFREWFARLQQRRLLPSP